MKLKAIVLMLFVGVAAGLSAVGYWRVFPTPPRCGSDTIIVGFDASPVIAAAIFENRGYGPNVTSPLHSRTGQCVAFRDIGGVSNGITSLMDGSVHVLVASDTALPHILQMVPGARVLMPAGMDLAPDVLISSASSAQEALLKIIAVPASGIAGISIKAYGEGHRTLLDSVPGLNVRYQTQAKNAIDLGIGSAPPKRGAGMLEEVAFGEPEWARSTLLSPERTVPEFFVSIAGNRAAASFARGVHIPGTPNSLTLSSADFPEAAHIMYREHWRNGLSVPKIEELFSKTEWPGPAAQAAYFEPLAAGSKFEQDFRAARDAWGQKVPDTLSEIVSVPTLKSEFGQDYPCEMALGEPVKKLYFEEGARPVPDSEIWLRSWSPPAQVRALCIKAYTDGAGVAEDSERVARARAGIEIRGRPEWMHVDKRMIVPTPDGNKSPPNRRVEIYALP